MHCRMIKCLHLSWFWFVAGILTILILAKVHQEEPPTRFAALTGSLLKVDTNSVISSNFIDQWKSRSTDQSNHSRFRFADQSTPPTEPTLVLIWTTFFSGRWTAAPKYFEGCPADLNCITTFDRDRVNDSSAILFHVRDFQLNDVPMNRYPDQYYIFSLWEPPAFTEVDLGSPQVRHFFNLTLTYRVDSDGYSAYAMFQKTVSRDIDIENIAGGKSKVVAWFASNCKTPGQRELFVDELSKHVPVDVYGKCGKFKCKRSFSLQDPCADMLTKKYKFYLSLENSLCKDYVTEKFYQRMNSTLIVLVVMERKLLMDTIIDNSIAAVINKSIIAVDDFPNVKALAEYLLYLDKNITAYTEYLQWRNSVRVILRDPPQCELCRVIKERKEHQIDIADWWIRKAACHSWQNRSTT